MIASVKARHLITSALHPSYNFFSPPYHQPSSYIPPRTPSPEKHLENSPGIGTSACLIAARLCSSVSATSNFPIPSICVKSSLSFSKARLVNSPASAYRRPLHEPIASRTARITAVEPWIWNSAKSSPVYELGEGKNRVNARSKVDESVGWISLRREARRAAGAGACVNCSRT